MKKIAGRKIADEMGKMGIAGNASELGSKPSHDGVSKREQPGSSKPGRLVRVETICFSVAATSRRRC